MPPSYAPRRLLVAAVGVATVNYVACGKETKEIPTSANLAVPIVVPDVNVAPLATDAATTAEPPEASVIEAGSPRDAGKIIVRLPPAVGNLPAPPPFGSVKRPNH